MSDGPLFPSICSVKKKHITGTRSHVYTCVTRVYIFVHVFRCVTGYSSIPTKGRTPFP